MKFWTGTLINKLEPAYIFVFGSNPEGRHGAGAAKHAMKFGAVNGKEVQGTFVAKHGFCAFTLTTEDGEGIARFTNRRVVFAKIRSMLIEEVCYDN